MHILSGDTEYRSQQSRRCPVACPFIDQHMLICCFVFILYYTWTLLLSPASSLIVFLPNLKGGFNEAFKDQPNFIVSCVGHCGIRLSVIVPEYLWWARLHATCWVKQMNNIDLFVPHGLIPLN